MEFLIGLALVVLAISTRVSLNRALERLKKVEDDLTAQWVAKEELERQLRKIKAEMAGSAQVAAPPPPTVAPPAPPVSAPVPPPVAPQPPSQPIVTPRPAVPVGAPPAPTPTAMPPRPPVPPVRPSPPSPPPPPPKPAFDWEGLIGVRLFAAIAGIALLVGAVFFLKYSIEQGWLSPPIRVALAVIAAIGMLVGCELKAARKYPATANALDASAIAILF